MRVCANLLDEFDPNYKDSFTCFFSKYIFSLKKYEI